MTRAGLNLVDAVEALRIDAPVEPALNDPLQLILWENIGYLIDDERRSRLFAEFGARIGFDPARIATADESVLMDIATRGGMRPETRVQRWRSVARIVLEECEGDLDGKLRALPVAKARALLKRFPSIGDPGADKILLFTGVAATPSVESNGLRTLARLGFVEEQRSYAASYRAAVEALRREGGADRDWLTIAYTVLRRHGRSFCTRAAPNCLACPLDEVCAHQTVRTL